MNPQKEQKNMLYKLCKQILDIVVAILGIILFSPAFIMIPILIKLDSKGPVIFRGKRLGLYGTTFTKYKFRTMVENAEEKLKDYIENHPEIREEYKNNYKISNDPRVTRVGRLLRKSCLDELPQLFNVLKGDMSIVGPRDILPKELEEKYGDKADKFLSVKPGITGYWQVNGRNETSYEERVKMDMYYIDNQSIMLDLKIILKTIPVVLTGYGTEDI